MLERETHQGACDLSVPRRANSILVLGGAHRARPARGGNSLFQEGSARWSRGQRVSDAQAKRHHQQQHRALVSVPMARSVVCRHVQTGSANIIVVERAAFPKGPRPYLAGLFCRVSRDKAGGKRNPDAHPSAIPRAGPQSRRHVWRGAPGCSRPRAQSHRAGRRPTRTSPGHRARRRITARRAGA